jgi:hypothetical protein
MNGCGINILHIYRLVEKLYIKNQPEKAAYLEACVNKLVNSKENDGLKNVWIHEACKKDVSSSINVECSSLRRLIRCLTFCRY